jgi:hypothetical protein
MTEQSMANWDFKQFVRAALISIAVGVIAVGGLFLVASFTRFPASAGFTSCTCNVAFRNSTELHYKYPPWSRASRPLPPMPRYQLFGVFFLPKTLAPPMTWCDGVRYYSMSAEFTVTEEPGMGVGYRCLWPEPYLTAVDTFLAFSMLAGLAIYLFGRYRRNSGK